MSDDMTIRSRPARHNSDGRTTIRQTLYSERNLAYLVQFFLPASKDVVC